MVGDNSVWWDKLLMTGTCMVCGKEIGETLKCGCDKLLLLVDGTPTAVKVVKAITKTRWEELHNPEAHLGAVAA